MLIMIEATRTILDGPEIVSRMKIRRFIVGNFTKVTPLTWSPWVENLDLTDSRVGNIRMRPSVPGGGKG